MQKENRKILIIEEVNQSSRNLKENLIQIACEITKTLKKGEAILACIQKETPHLILVNHSLKNDKTIKELDFPVVYFSTQDDDELFNLAKKTTPYSFVNTLDSIADLNYKIDINIYKFLAEKNTKSNIKLSQLSEAKEDCDQFSKELEKVVFERTTKLNDTVNRLNNEVEEKLQIEEQITQSLKEKEVLLNEITHRVKNNLQVISSLLKLQKQSVNHPLVESNLNEIECRIKTMSLIHECIYNSKDFNCINFKEYIDSLVAYLLVSTKNGYIQIKSDVEKFDLTIDTATTCGLIITELLTNALKYAFNPKEAGLITLKMTKEENDYFKINILDNGKGYASDIDFKKTKTLGMQLVMGLTSQLQGKIEKIQTLGTHFEILIKDTKKHKYE